MNREFENRAFENASEAVGLAEINPTEKNDVNGGIGIFIIDPKDLIVCCYNIPPAFPEKPIFMIQG